MYRQSCSNLFKAVCKAVENLFDAARALRNRLWMTAEASSGEADLGQNRLAGQ
jgi:hypothetical protein